MHVPRLLNAKNRAKDRVKNRVKDRRRPLARLLGGALFPLLAAHAALGAAPAVGASSQHNNLGVAYMNEQSPAKALSEFETAMGADPVAVIPATNTGVALLYLRRTAEAEEAFAHALKVNPDDAAAWYSLGLTRYSDGASPDALTALRHAETLAPKDADVHYFLGTVLSAQADYPAAAAEFTQALVLNPLHASAEFGLARADQHLKDVAGARQHLLLFNKMTEAKNGTLISSNYGEQGRLAMARDLLAPQTAAPAMIPVTFAPVPGARPASAASAFSGAACMLGEGRDRLLLLPAAGHGLDVYKLGADGALSLSAPKLNGPALQGDGVACAVGDYDNDGHPDIALSLKDRVVLLHNDGAGRFEDRTAVVGLKGGEGAAALAFVDYDHDGDLDLLVTGAHGNTMWRNNGNSTFTDATESTGLRAAASGTRAAVLSDLNNDRAVDLVVANDTGAPVAYLNPRDGLFRPRAVWGDVPALAPARSLAVADFNKDGWMDLLVCHAGRPGLSLWRNTAGSGFAEVPLPVAGMQSATAAIPIDFDNDGWIDVAVLAQGPEGVSLHMLRNLGGNHFADVSAQLGLNHVDVRTARGLMAADLTAHAAPDLLVSFTDRPPLVLRNVGGDRHRALRIQLTGLADNKSGIGTKIEVFSGTEWQKFEVTGAEGYLGQGSTEILAGLGDAPEVDVLRLLWPTGVPQDEVHLALAKPATYTELDRRGSSCPVLFAWNGSRYTFVTDVIGAGVVGHWVAPGRRNHPDADEWIKVDGDLLKPSRGRLSLRFGEPMEEVNYLDQLRLVAVDHPTGTEVYPEERFLDAPPFASGKPVLLSPGAHLPAGAWDNAGHDALPVLAHRDRHYLRDFTNLSFAGFATDHTLTLDVGDWNPAGNPQQPLRLALSGYVEYFSASSMYAASQAGISPQSPSLQAQRPDGSWVTVLADMGFPAGLPRTILVDLTGKLPAGAHRLRIQTNLQIYWDQVLVDNAAPSPASMHVTELPLAAAQLEFRGYPRQIEGPTPGELTYDYNSVSLTGPFSWQRGAYTHYGSVLSLLARQDDRFVVFGTGEDIDAEFDTATLPAPPPGWKRDYLFYANGYVKDMDFYDALPFTVGELPFHAMTAYPYPTSEHFPTDKLDADWNDRFETGERAQRFGFNYQPSPAAPPLD